MQMALKHFQYELISKVLPKRNVVYTMYMLIVIIT